MLVNGLVANNISYKGRLLQHDIMRMPSAETNLPDYYEYAANKQKKPKKETSWKNVFTVLTFGLTGLYIAHRNNLFNPIKRETKKIIHSEALQIRVKEFVESAINPETYTKATKDFLKKLSVDKIKSEDFQAEANKVLSDNESFNNLFSAVTKQLADDKDKVSLQKGFVVDILDKLSSLIEKMLTKNKNHGLEYKNAGESVISTIFAKSADKPSQIEQTLLDVIENRSAFTIENFVKDSLIQTNLGKAMAAKSV